jgi:CysZ protein
MILTPNTIPTGFAYFMQGAGLLMQSGMKRFVLVPLLANVVVFFIVTGLLIHYFSSVTDWFNQSLSMWSWLGYFAAFIAAALSGIAFVLMLLIYGYSFNLITNIIAAPFYGLLAEKLESRLRQIQFPAEHLPI